MRFGVVVTNAGKVFARLEGDKAIEYGAAPWLGGKETGKVHAFSPGDLACPVTPSKILCVGRNYAAHAKEMGNDVPKEPMIFLKPPSALLDPGGTVRLLRESMRIEHEAELVIVIGKRVRRVSRADARAAVFGFTCANDISARDLQKSDGQWWRAKGADTFAPIGPWIETDVDPKDLSIVCRVNGEVKQNARTSSMIFDVDTIVAHASSAMTLEPGDIILTGTPDGVSPLKDGDTVDVEVQNIGTLTVRVAADASST
jgi:2-keto-4-pentenoate hydratase/2-oxohepta-3-ene-1,7-dioic acid hydratase in catechol pathway